MISIPNLKLTSTLSEAIVVRDSPIQGKGLFAEKPFSKGEILIVWGGILVTTDQFKSGSGLSHSNVGVDEGIYLVTPSDSNLGDDDFMNHSCEPNVGLRDEITLVAMRDIAIEEELCMDYAIELSDPSYIMKHTCNCGSPNCRRTITGEDWKLEDFQRLNMGFCSPFIARRIAALKK